MQFLKFRPATKYGRAEYQYFSGEEGDVIEVSLYYAKGGDSYFGEGNDPRGIRMSLNPIKLEKRVDSQGNSYTSSIMTVEIGGPNRGISAVVLEMLRGNPKKLLEAAEFLDDTLAMAANTWQTDRPAARVELLSKIDEFQKKMGLVKAA
jgi:hypothetical protein